MAAKYLKSLPLEELSDGASAKTVAKEIMDAWGFTKSETNYALKKVKF